MLKATLRERRLDLGAGVRNARRSWVERRLLYVRVSDGRVEGIGEAAPLPGFGDDTFETCQAELEAFSWDVDLEAPLTAWTEGFTSPAARFAIQTALLDLIGHRTQTPLAALLAERLGTTPSAVEVAAWIDGSVTSADAALEDGHQTLKLKVGRSLAPEIHQAMSLREHVGSDVRLRFDANGALQETQAGFFLEGLAAAAPEFVEEPVAALGALSEQEVPLALDETLLKRAGYAALHRRDVVAVVLKPMALGLGEAMRLAQEARASGRAAIASHLLGGSIEMACATAFASAIGGDHAHGLGHHGTLDALGVPKLPAKRPILSTPGLPR